MTAYFTRLLRNLFIVAMLASGGCTGQPSVPIEDAAPAGTSTDEVRLATLQFRVRYGREPDTDDVYSWLGESCVAERRWDSAVSCFERISDSHPLYGRSARIQQAGALMELSRVASAETQYEAFLKLRRDTPDSSGLIYHAQAGLVFILGVELRFEDRQKILQSMVEAGEADAFHTLLSCFPTVFRWNGALTVAELDRWLRVDPGNPRLLAASARYLASLGNLDQARRIVESLLRDHPRKPETISSALYVFQQAGKWDDIERLLAVISDDEFCSLWMVPLMRGHMAMRDRQGDAAVRHYSRVITMDPASVEAWSGLGRAARASQDVELERGANLRVQALARIQNRLGQVTQEPANLDPLIEIAELCHSAEMPEFARLVAQVVLRMDPQSEPARQLLNSISSTPN